MEQNIYNPLDPWLTRSLKKSYANSDDCDHFNCWCTEETARCLQTQEHGHSWRAAEMNLLHLKLDSVSLLRKLFAGDKKMCVCVCAFFNRAHMCVLLSPSVLWNKYARLIYCLYLGEIDGNAGEQNIYHFCLWLIVVLGMAALQREGGGAEEVVVVGRQWRKKKQRKGERKCSMLGILKQPHRKRNLRDFLKCLRFQKVCGQRRPTGRSQGNTDSDFNLAFFFFYHFTLIFWVSREALSLPSALLIHTHLYYTVTTLRTGFYLGFIIIPYY